MSFSLKQFDIISQLKVLEKLPYLTIQTATYLIHFLNTFPSNLFHTKIHIVFYKKKIKLLCSLTLGRYVKLLMRTIFRDLNPCLKVWYPTKLPKQCLFHRQGPKLSEKINHHNTRIPKHDLHNYIWSCVGRMSMYY